MARVGMREEAIKTFRDSCRVTPRGIARTACLAVALLAVSCGEDGGDVDLQPTPKATVIIEDGRYQPPTVRVPAGARVTWVNLNADFATVETAGVGFMEFDRDKLDREDKFDLHTFSIGEAESAEFDTPGRYEYYSSYDNDMKGTVIVTAGGRRRAR